MGTTHQLLTLEEFHEQYDGKKPYYEFRRGEAVQKSMPTWLHNLLERVLVEMFERSGYSAIHEVELRISGNWHPIPDVLAHAEIEEPYPTKPVDIVAEILSPADRMSEILEKCADYEQAGIRAIFVLDPVQRKAWRWSAGSLCNIPALDLPNGASLELGSVWSELDSKIKRT